MRRSGVLSLVLVPFAVAVFFAAGSVPANTFQIDFPIAGEYWISFPGTVTTPALARAEDLYAAFPNPNDVAFVSKFDTLTDTFHEWDGGTCGGAGVEPGAGTCGSMCFCIELGDGEGFFVSLTAPATFAITGGDSPTVINLDGPGPTSFAGVHLISLPYSTPLVDAEDLIFEINAAAGFPVPPVVVSVARLVTATGLPELYTGTFGVNFPIVPAEGYQVVVTSDVSYIPAFNNPLNNSDLSVMKSDSADPILVGTNLIYTVTVQNNGPDDAMAVGMADTLPPTVTFVSAVSNQGSCMESAGVVTCEIGDLLAGAGATITIEVTADLVGVINNTASVTGKVFDPFPADNTAIESTTVLPPCTDGDGDGFVVCDSSCIVVPSDSCGECDDTDAAINPLAVEICDGIDNNCDDLTDVGCQTSKVTGGGEIAVPGGMANFGFIVQRKTMNGLITGQLQYYNHARSLNVHSTLMTALFTTGTTATFSGDCTKNGAPCSFTVTLQDLGEPGRNVDHFEISVSGEPIEGDSAPITKGNIQFH